MPDALTAPAQPEAAGSLANRVDTAEKQIIEAALMQSAGNVAQATELLKPRKKRSTTN